ncbi:MAG: type II secretion system protein [Candidatus Omnitrophota bacterium]
MIFRIRNNKRSITLIELTICIGIIGIAVPSLLALFNYQLKMVEKARVITQATYLAQQIMEEQVFAKDFYTLRGTVAAGNNPTLTTSLGGDFTGDLIPFRWEIYTNSVNASASNFNDPAAMWDPCGGLSNYLRVRVVVYQDKDNSDTQGPGEFGVELVTLITPSGSKYYTPGS